MSGDGFHSARWAALVFAALALAGPAYAQTATVSGFISDSTDGQALEGATVALYPFADGFDAAPAYGTASNPDGLHLLTRILPGRYLLQVSFIGYRTHRDTLDLAAAEVHTLTLALVPETEVLQEVRVESERLSRLAPVTAGHQRIRPEEIELVPAPDLSADLATYLTTLPGIVTTGDRGGQFFVRGGEPSQNLVLLDGMILYQPFHVLGFYSAFPADVIDHVDLYAGGFGAKYAGRLSSVIDVAARPGNNRRVAGMASASPFVSALRLEGPLVPGHASWLVSARESFIDRTDERLYGEEMPFRFGDAFGKVQASLGPRHRLSLALLRTHDRGTLVREVADERAQELRWTNSGGSLRWLLLPRTLPVAAEVTLSRSRHEMQQGQPGEPARTTMVRNTRVALDATFAEGAFFGGATTLAGWDVVFAHARNDLGGLFQNVEDAGIPVPSFGLYAEPTYDVGGGLRVTPGLRLQWYNVRHGLYLEPRLRAVWQQGIHQVSGALGLYRQQLIGLSDRRDAASVFTAWTGIPRQENEIEERLRNEILRGRIGNAVHGLLGYRASPRPWLEYAVEGFYKRVTNLFVAEWTALPRLTTRLQPATGRSVGFEARVELRRRPFYGYVTYGLSQTVYAADGEAIRLWYGTERLRYRPPHDRRHQVNALVSVSALGFEVGLRWQFGSGLPYTRPLAFDGFGLVDDIRTAFALEHSRRVIYERPFDSVLPTYHRLDVSVERTWELAGASVTVQVSGINVYDRRNIFYVDVFTLARKDQLPFVPSFGLRVAFE